MISQAFESLREACSRVKVVPVLVIEDPADAAPLAGVLTAGGLEVLEVTLRTPRAWLVAEAMKAACPGAAVGVGSVRTVADLDAAKARGLDFAVSPGCTVSLLRAAKRLDLPFMPGVATPSEALLALEEGYDFIKFFPANINGGAKALKAMAAPLGSIRFCPTGGVNLQNVVEYLACPNVLCVGGSWLVPGAALKARDWSAVAAEVQALKSVIG